MKLYKVGGYVRDKLLGKPAHDVDYLVVGSTVEEMLQSGYKQVGKEFPVFLKKGCEYALARKEVKTGDKHTDFSFEFGPEVTLEEDLLRRDFTINAICEDVETGEIVDLFNGIQDIRSSIIRHINSEHFVEDPLRVLRGARFAAQLNFGIHPETLELFKRMVADGMLQYLTPERVWGEINKALNSVYFYKFIEILDSINALELILPEIYALKEVLENEEFHPEGNAYTHTLLCLKQVKNVTTQLFNVPISAINFSVLCHDIGKALTDKQKWPSHFNHEELGLEVLEKMCLRLRIPNNSKSEASYAIRYHMYQYKYETMTTKKKYDLVNALTDFKNDYYLRLLMCVWYCDLYGRGGAVPESRIYNYLNASANTMVIFNILKDITSNTLPTKVFEHLNKFKGKEYGKLLRDAKISYLKKYLKVN